LRRGLEEARPSVHLCRARAVPGGKGTTRKVVEFQQRSDLLAR
jgi:hypothetical protein